MYREFHFTSYDGTILYGRESGSGPLLLLIHGSCTDCDFFKDTAVILSRWFHVVTYDRRGHARSGWHDMGDSLTAHAKDASALIRHFNRNEPAYVVGHSYGGSVAMKLAELHPEQIRKMVLNEPIGDLARSSDKEKLTALGKMEVLAAEGDLSGAMALFMPFVGTKDPRAREATEEELNNIEPDSRTFFSFDLPALLHFHPDYAALKAVPMVMTVNEQNKDSSVYTEALELAKLIEAPVRYYPAAHNCGFNLPREFAYLVTGTLMDCTRAESHERMITSYDGTKLFVREFGKGTPLLMVHGACSDADFYKETGAVLGQWFHVITFDRRGNARSEWTDPEGTVFEANVKDMMAVLNAAAPGEKIDLVAHSAGGAMAMLFLQEHGDLVNKTLLYEPTCEDNFVEDPDKQAALVECETLLKAGKSGKALRVFMPLVGEKDPRGAEPTAEEVRHQFTSSKTFIRKEFLEMYHFHPDYSLLRPQDITIAVGELSEGDPKYEEAFRTQAALDAKRLYYPGYHNCAHDLPESFAYLTAGALQ